MSTPNNKREIIRKKSISEKKRSEKKNFLKTKSVIKSSRVKQSKVKAPPEEDFDVYEDWIVENPSFEEEEEDGPPSYSQWVTAHYKKSESLKSDPDMIDLEGRVPTNSANAAILNAMYMNMYESFYCD